MESPIDDIHAMELLLEHLKRDPYGVIEDLKGFMQSFLDGIKMSPNLKTELTAFAEQYHSVRSIWRRGLATSFVQGWLTKNPRPNP